MPMRVIAGELRHRLLVYPENNKDIRPTKDRIREAFFSIVGDINNKTFLDLYAGCGSIGIEAISRGASHSYFVDINNESLNYVKKNIASLNIADRCIVYKLKDLDALTRFKEEGIKFDIIYLDPPYESGLYQAALDYIFLNNLLNNKGIVACEYKDDISINPLWDSKNKEYHYGEIKLLVLRKN